MPTQSKHASINIGLIQAREALMTQFRPILNQANITDQQWRIIRLLAENGTLDFQDLANKACILRPSLTGILTRLEKAGMAVRLKPSNDQRRVFLKLTQEGEKLYQSIGEKVDERYDAIENVFSKEKAEEILKIVGLEKFIKEMENKDSVAENGINLSGGEKQRISIARALIRENDILLADEAFSNLDNETALKIEKELLKLENITLIAVTHRLFEETLRNFDEILVLDNGKIIEKGTYNELINKKSFFYKMYSLSKND